jgi:hypothetical protein
MQPGTPVIEFRAEALAIAAVVSRELGCFLGALLRSCCPCHAARCSVEPTEPGMSCVAGSVGREPARTFSGLRGRVLRAACSRGGAHSLIADSGWKPAWNNLVAGNAVGLMAAIRCDATYQVWDESGANDSCR